MHISKGLEEEDKFVDSRLIIPKENATCDWLEKENEKILGLVRDLWSALFAQQMESQRDLYQLLRHERAETLSDGRHALLKDQVIIGIIDEKARLLLKIKKKIFTKQPGQKWTKENTNTFLIRHGIRWT